MVALVILIALCGVGLGVWTFVRSGGGIFFRILNGLAGLSAGLAVCMAIARVCQLAPADWMGAKLAPIVGMVKGIPLYQDPNTGVMTAWIYGPVGAMVLAPTALGKTPTSCGLIGSCIALFCYLAPAAWLIWIASKGRFTALAGLALLVVAWMPMTSDDLLSAAFLAAPDAPAIGFAACACAALQLRRNAVTMIISALAAVLAVWSKQNFSLLLVGLIVWVLLEDGWKQALIYTCILAAIGSIISIILIASFGAHNMLFHMVSLPGSQPFKSDESGPLMMWLINVRDFIGPLIPSLGLILLVLLLDKAAMPAERGIRRWFVSRKWSLLLIAAISLAPGAFLGMAKFGGGANSTASVDYFLVLTVVTGVISIVQNMTEHAMDWQKGLQAALAVLVVTLAARAIANPPSNSTSVFSRLQHPYDNATEQAYHFVLSHPNQVYCPANPLVTLLADGQLYHFDYGYVDRISAKINPSNEQILRHLPRNMSAIIYDEQPQFRTMEHSLVEFRRQVQLPELPNCIVITR